MFLEVVSAHLELVAPCVGGSRGEMRGIGEGGREGGETARNLEKCTLSNFQKPIIYTKSGGGRSPPDFSKTWGNLKNEYFENLPGVTNKGGNAFKTFEDNWFEPNNA